MDILFIDNNLKLSYSLYIMMFHCFSYFDNFLEVVDVNRAIYSLRVSTSDVVVSLLGRSVWKTKLQYIVE